MKIMKCRVLLLLTLLAMLFCLLPATAMASEVQYYVAGTENLCGINWSADDANNVMANNIKIYSNVEPGTYELKVTTGTWDEPSYGDWFGNNIRFTVTETCNVTVTLVNPANGGVSVTGEYVNVLNSVSLVGDGSGSWLNGEVWKTDTTSNSQPMTTESVYTFSFPNVPGNAQYEFKFLFNAAINEAVWEEQFGAPWDIDLVTPHASYYYKAEQYGSPKNIVFKTYKNCISATVNIEVNLQDRTFKIWLTDDEYPITVDTNIQHGSVSVQVSSAIWKDKVYVTATPDEGYVLDGWSFICSDNTSSSSIDEDEHGPYFTMPPDSVTVSASFKLYTEIESVTITPYDAIVFPGEIIKLTTDVQGVGDLSFAWSMTADAVTIDDDGYATISPNCSPGSTIQVTAWAKEDADKRATALLRVRGPLHAEKASEEPLYYDGTLKNGVIINNTDWATITGDYYQQSAPGTYTTTITPQNEWYLWEDTRASGSRTFTWSIVKRTGSGTVTMADWVHGAEPKQPEAVSDTNDGEVTFLYKIADADDSTYTAEVPTLPGDYIVKATFAETSLYSEAVAYNQFSITPRDSYSITYIDNTSYVVFADERYTAQYGEPTPAFTGSLDYPGFDFVGWEPEVSTTVVDDVIYYAQWESNTLTVTFDSNGGNRSMQPQTITIGEPTKLKANAFTRDFYDFDGWNTQPNGIGTAYADGEEVCLQGDVVLYAQWKLKTFYVTFDPNGGTGVMEPQAFTAGIYAPLKPNEFVREGYRFLNWNRFADGTGFWYTDEQVFYDATSNMTLYAQWEKNTYTVTYTDGVDGEELFADQVSNVAYGAATPAFNGTPTRTGYTFTGWSPEVAATVTGNATYTAQWTKSIQPGGKPLLTLTFDANGGTGTMQPRRLNWIRRRRSCAAPSPA